MRLNNLLYRETRRCPHRIVVFLFGIILQKVSGTSNEITPNSGKISLQPDQLINPLKTSTTSQNVVNIRSFSGTRYQFSDWIRDVAASHNGAPQRPRTERHNIMRHCKVVDRGNRRKTQENITIDISNIHGIVLFYYLRNNRQDLFIYIITRTTNDNANQFLNSANACFVNISRCLLSLEIILFHILS